MNNEIMQNGSSGLSASEAQAIMSQMESVLINAPQAECSVVHHFSPGLYIREVSMPAGATVVGHHHKTEHLNVMLKGRMILMSPDGTRNEVAAPFMYTAPPGRKSAYILEDVVWQNIFPTEETDIDALEDALLDKSATFMQGQESTNTLEHVAREEDREDFVVAIGEFGYTPESALEIAMNEGDQIEMPDYCRTFRISKSNIEGDGFFVTATANKGDTIAPACIDGKRTPAGRYVNHSKRPNAKMVQLPNGDINLIATRRIKGCCGGSVGEEVTVCYREALNVRRKVCQQ
jgi:hypothetical protein